MTSVLVIPMLLGAPALLIAACLKWTVLQRAGLVLLAFGSGILCSMVLRSFNSDMLASIQATQTQITELSIALALPMLVFSVDIRAAFSLAGRTLWSMFLAVLCVSALSVVLALLFADDISHMWQVAGMAVGAYTGGGPNMAAIKAAIEGDQAVFVTMTTYDILLSAMYLLFVLALAKPVFRHVLPAFTRHSESQSGDQHFAHMADESAAAYRRVLQTGFRKDTFKSLFLAVLVVAVSVVLSQLLPAGMQSAGTIVLITTLGLACSLSASVRRWATSFHLGMYLVLVFCFTMGSLTDVGIFSRLDVALFSYIGCLLIGSLLLHALLCRLFRIDVDTFLMASAAAIMSVPFVPVVAGALRNPGLIVPGFAAAILGYVAGNYLGIGVAFLTRWLLAA